MSGDPYAAAPLPTGTPQSITLPPVPARYDLGTALDATEFVVGEGQQVVGFAVCELPSAVAVQMFLGNNPTAFRIRQGTAMMFPCNPLNDGIRLESTPAVPGASLQILWVFGAGNSAYFTGGA